jgi:4-aminobutyrate aminotransferase/(S)-3-amino-2-methylpropionate transaminase
MHIAQSYANAIREQAGKYIHTSFNGYLRALYIALCEELAEILPHGDKPK